MKTKQIYMYLLLVLTTISCQNKKQTEFRETASTIDSLLQTKVTEILKDKMVEINAISGQAIVMETQTGEIKAMTSIDSTYNRNYNFTHAQETGLMRSISLLATLESGKVKYTDILDTKMGKRLYKGNIVKDANWQRGGWGIITVGQSLIINSNIGTIIGVEKAYGKAPKLFYSQLKKMSYGEPAQIQGIHKLSKAILLTPDSSNWKSEVLGHSAIGLQQKIAPIQMLAFYNAIANKGKMIKPTIHKESIEIINPQIADKTHIDSLRQALICNIAEGLGRAARSEKVIIAGLQGTVQISTQEDNTERKLNTEYAAEFCGYFPANTPKYTIIVSINKMGLPVSGGLMAGDVFRKIVDYMINR